MNQRPKRMPSRTVRTKEAAQDGERPELVGVDCLVRRTARHRRQDHVAMRCAERSSLDQRHRSIAHDLGGLVGLAPGLDRLGTHLPCRRARRSRRTCRAELAAGGDRHPLLLRCRISVIRRVHDSRPTAVGQVVDLSACREYRRLESSRSASLNSNFRVRAGFLCRLLGLRARSSLFFRTSILAWSLMAAAACVIIRFCLPMKSSRRLVGEGRHDSRRNQAEGDQGQGHFGS